MSLNLRDIRKRSGMTQERLAEVIGATRRQVGAWERGENDLPMDYAVLIADVLQCSVDDIAGRQSLPDVPGFPLTNDELELLAIYRVLTAVEKKSVLAVARAMAGDAR